MGWYNKGTIAIAANSATVTGTGSLWLDDGIAPGDMLLVGSYTREVLTVNSNTSITLATAITTAVAAGSAYSIAPLGGASTNGAMMTATLTKAVAEALRTDAALLIGFSNMLYSTTPGDITVTLTDGSQVTVPNWAKVSTLSAAMSAVVGTRVDWKGGATWQGTTEATYNATAAPTAAAAGGDASSTIDVNNVEYLRVALRAYRDAAGKNFANLRFTGSNMAAVANWYLGEDGTLSAPAAIIMSQALNMNNQNISGVPGISFNSAQNARAQLGGMGIAAAGGSRLQIPINSTQALLIQFGTKTTTTDSAGAGTLLYDQAFSTIISHVMNDGDGNASSGCVLAQINGVNNSQFSYKAYNVIGGGAKVNATIRINFCAMGIINL